MARARACGAVTAWCSLQGPEIPEGGPVLVAWLPAGRLPTRYSRRRATQQDAAEDRPLSQGDIGDPLPLRHRHRHRHHGVDPQPRVPESRVLNRRPPRVVSARREPSTHILALSQVELRSSRSPIRSVPERVPAEPHRQWDQPELLPDRPSAPSHWDLLHPSRVQDQRALQVRSSPVHRLPPREAIPARVVPRRRPISHREAESPPPGNALIRG